jgi:hypothetical protein
VQTHEHVAYRTWPAQRAPQRARGAPDEVRFVERHTRGITLDRERTGTGNAVDRVVQRQRLEDGTQLVKAVGTRTQDA